MTTTLEPSLDDLSALQAMKQRAEKKYVEFVNVTKAYPNPHGDAFVVVENFNLVIAKGDLVSVIGHSGCGKSTVLSMIAGLSSITSGSVILDGKEIAGPAPERAVVFQSPCLLPWMSAFDNVMLGVKQVYPHASALERVQIVEYYMNLVGLYDSRFKFPGELSGGMQQRVGIARAISLKPKVLLLDEPFGRLDSLTRMGLQDVIMGIINQEQLTSILITHDVDEAIYMSTKVCMMTNGPRAKVGKVLEIDFPRPRIRDDVLEHPEYYNIRADLINFLTEQGHRH